MAVISIIICLLCALCWGMTIKLVLRRDFSSRALLLRTNRLLAGLMALNLLVILPAFYFLLLKVSVSRPVQGITLVAVTIDSLATVGLVCFSLVSFASLFRPAPKDVQYLLILGAAVNNGQASPILASRLERALAYWHNHPTVLLIVSGGREPHQKMTEAAVMANYLVQHGLAPTMIIMEDQARNTYQNLMLTSHLVPARAKVLVVTSDFHVLRTRLNAYRLRLHWTVVGAITPLRLRPLTYLRDYLGVIRDWRWLTGIVTVLIVIVIEIIVIK